MKSIIKIFFSLVLVTFFVVDTASAQEESVTVDTLITIDDNGNEIRKIIKKRTLKIESDSGDTAQIKKLRSKKMMFIGEGEGGEHEVILKRLGDDSEDQDIEIIMRKDGRMDSDEPMIWIDADDKAFSFSTLDPAVSKKEMKSKELAQAIANESDDDSKKRLSEELDGLLNEIFDLKLEKMQSDLQKKSDMLEKKKALLERRRMSKAKMIQERKEKLLEEKNEKLQW